MMYDSITELSESYWGVISLVIFLNGMLTM